MIEYLGTYLFIMSAAGFFICAYDKRRARRKRGRVSEASLFAVCVIGGSLGVFAAMLATKHKIKKPRFVIPVALIMLLQATGLMFALGVF